MNESHQLFDPAAAGIGLIAAPDYAEEPLGEVVIGFLDELNRPVEYVRDRDNRRVNGRELWRDLEPRTNRAPCGLGEEFPAAVSSSQSQ